MLSATVFVEYFKSEDLIGEGKYTDQSIQFPRNINRYANQQEPETV